MRAAMLNFTPRPALRLTEIAMLEQARTQIARQTVDPVREERTKTLRAQVSVKNLAGQRFPSGVSFGRAFITFGGKAAESKVLWASGRSNDAGVVIDEHNQPIAGELWWQPDCSERLPSKWQPNYQQITTPNQAQIYQELITDARRQLTTSFLSINSHPQSIPPFYQQDRYCTAENADGSPVEDTERLR
jgi:hypothetical protein